MLTENQSEVIAFLSRPEAYGDGGAGVERVETHISEIFLIGRSAYKLKRAARFPYLDFSTVEKRHLACEAEVAVNRRTAPALYLGVIAVTRDAEGRLGLGGPGPAVDWLVAMARFDQEALFDRLARRGRLDRGMMERLAETVARFHQAAAPTTEMGGAAGIAAIIDSNAQCFTEAGPAAFDPAKLEALGRATVARHRQLAPLLDARRREGRVRHCHGDLHLRNIVLIDDDPTLFDAIEFSQTLAHIDVLYDLAFLLMDLDHDGLRTLANAVLNRYLDITADDAGLAALPLFLSMRAAIRAHVGAAAAATLADRAAAARQAEEARAYLEMALGYLEPARPRLVAVGGLSGSGKSRAARQVAPHLGAAPGARVLRSDVIRKRLAGVDAATRLGPEGYSADMTERTYATLYGHAREALAAGYAVVADAVFARPDQRRAIAEVAREAGAAFDGLWLEAPPEVMAGRIARRRGNFSDATPEVLRRQLAYDLGEIAWTRIDTGATRERTVARAREVLGV